MTEEETQTKLKSRKFIVWMVWLVLTVLILAFSIGVMIVTKTMPETLTGLIEKELGWFFAVSMMYLGMNAGQKTAFALSDAIRHAIRPETPETSEDGAEG